MTFRRSLAWLTAGVLLAAAGPPASALAGTGSATTMTFEQLGYGDRTVRGPFATADYFFPVPAAEETPPGARLDLDISHSPMLVPDRSTVTVIVDGIAVTSTWLTADNLVHGKLTVDLPS